MNTNLGQLLIQGATALSEALYPWKNLSYLWPILPLCYHARDLAVSMFSDIGYAK